MSREGLVILLHLWVSIGVDQGGVDVLAAHAVILIELSVTGTGSHMSLTDLFPRALPTGCLHDVVLGPNGPYHHLLLALRLLEQLLSRLNTAICMHGITRCTQ